MAYVHVAGEDCVVQERGVAADHALGPLCIVGLRPATWRDHVRVVALSQAADSLQHPLEKSTPPS